MKNKIKNFILDHYPVIIIGLIVLIIFITNYENNTYLTGWDNLHPEFDFNENIKRSIFAVWQEYQGTGLLGGMGHAADLVRQIFLAILSVFIPDNLLRYTSTLFMLFAGSTGAYYLIKNILESISNKDVKLISLAGAVFYLLNISTIQTFYIPFEAFVAHYAAIPWILLSTILFYKYPNKKHALITFIIFIATSPQAYIPTLFVSSLLAIGFISLPFLLLKPRTSIKTFIKLLLLIVLSNSFWLLPFIFFTLTSASVNVDSKINQMATELIFLQNKEYGDLRNVMQLKGYLFSNVEPNLQGNYDYILKAWIGLFNNPIVTTINFIIFSVILLGLYKGIRSRAKQTLGFALLFIFAFTMLATSTPPFSWISDLLRDNIQLFNQAFRFPYTKFLNIATISYAVLFSIGIFFIIEKLKKPISEKLIPIIFIALIIGIVFPVFKGEFFYEKETLKLPKEYQQTFDYFKTQNPNQRIANFPQYTFWGWNFYNWGYSGSGFLWYGIKQPILDRAFDVWSKENENYFWEINQALYSKNPNQFYKVLNKYDVKFLLLDKNVNSPSSAKSLFIPEFEEVVSQIPQITKEKEFGKIAIYKVKLGNNPTNFVSSINTIRISNNYDWSNYDQSYLKFGDYYSSEKAEIFYPFRSIFTGKEIKKSKFNISEKDKKINFIAPLPTSKEIIGLSIPTLVTDNNTLPVNIVAIRNGLNINIRLEIIAPEVYIKTGNSTKKIWENNIDLDLFSLSEDPNIPLKININGVSNFVIEDLKNGSKTIVGTASLTTTDSNNIVISSPTQDLDTSNILGEEIYNKFFQNESIVTLSEIEPNSSIIVSTQKTNDKYSNAIINPAHKVSIKQSTIVNCDNFRKDYFSYTVDSKEQDDLLKLSSANATPCISFYLPNLDHDHGYLVSTKHRNIEGRGLHFWILNEDQKTPVLDTYLSKSKDMTTTYAVIPPMEKFGKSYSVHFNNISIGKTKSGNELGEIKITPIPFHFISNIAILSGSKPQSFDKTDLTIYHPNQSIYEVENRSRKNTFISLSQGFSPYWKAYEVKDFGIINKIFPFKNKSIGETLKVNNWKNGWKVNSTQNKIIIVYIPQYLQYIGFFFVFLTFLILIFINLRSRHHSREFDTKEHV